MKKFYLLLLKIATVLLLLMTNSFAELANDTEILKTCGDGKTYDEDSDACSGPCAVNSSGAIILASNGMPYDADNSDAFRDSCNMIPDFYRVTIFKGGVCTSDPYSSSSLTIDYDSICDLYYNDNSGKQITLTNQGDGTATASPSLVEDGFNLGIKTYTHAFMVLSNHLKIKHDQDYDFSGTGTASEMRGGGSSISTGTTCWTINRTSTFSNLDGSTGSNHNSVELRTGTPDASESSTCCGSAVVTDESDACYFDYATEIIETFGEASGNWNESSVTARWPYAASSLGGGNKAAILLQSDNETVATSMEDGVRLLYMVELTNPLVITENTSRFDIKFGLSDSVSIDFGSTGDPFLFNVKHGADPVDILFEAN